jgi:two-component sensor histidine kinase
VREQGERARHSRGPIEPCGKPRAARVGKGDLFAFTSHVSPPRAFLAGAEESITERPSTEIRRLQKRCHPPHKCCFPREYAQLATPVSDQSTASGLALQRAWSSTRSRASHLNCSSATIRARFSPGRAGPRGARRGSETRFEDGTSRYLFGHATPLRDAQGNACGAVAAFVDITDRKHAEEQRDLLIAELNHRVKNTLATVISIARQSFSLGAASA